MIKVLIVSQIPPPYLGQLIMLEHLVRSQMPGVKLYHLPMRFSEEVSDVRRFSWRKLFRLFPLVARMIHARITLRPQVLYFVPASATRFSIFRDFAVLIPTRFLFPKTILHFHSSGHSELYAKLPVWQRWLFRLAYFHADAAIRLSELTPQDARMLKAHREYIVPNGIADLNPTELPSTPSSPNAENRPLRVLFIGALSQTKGVLVLLDACRQLAMRQIPFQLDIMGEFESDQFEAQVRRRMARYGLDQQITFLGQLTGAEKLAAFARADALCHPTLLDTLPLVLLEAMSFGLPIVATRLSGIPSIVDDGVTGFLTEPNDFEGIASHLQRLAHDPALRVRMGRAGRSKFEREYALSRHLERMRRVFLETAGLEVNEQRESITEAIAAT